MTTTTTTTAAAATTTRLDALLLEPGLASLIVTANNVLAPAAPQLGMLAMLNRPFRRAFAGSAADARAAFRALEEDRRFLAISALVTRDMLTRLHFKEDVDADFDDRSARNFYMFLYHKRTGAEIYVSRGPDCAVELESNLGVHFPGVIHVRTPDDWAQYAPVMRMFESKRRRVV